ncbi:MAG: hypothetical protein WC943_16565, partial [Elusimicrobiota bacterium]
DFARQGLLTAGLLLTLYAVLLLPGVRRRLPLAAGWAFAALVSVEILAFALSSRVSMSSRLDCPPAWKAAVQGAAPDARVLVWDARHANSGMVWGSLNLWGHDPLLSRRYAEFMAVSQGLPPDQGGQYLSFSKAHPALALLRLKHVLLESPDRPVVDIAGGLPRALLVPSWAVLKGRDEVLAAVFRQGMDPKKTAILETEPFDGASPPAPSKTPFQGSARILAEDTDFLDIEAETDRPAILLVTDAWAPGWRAASLSDGTKYRVIPADHVLRGIPLKPGRHRLRLEYAPASFRLGAWVSLASLALLLGWALRLKARA